jgi:hypothetical protein
MSDDCNIDGIVTRGIHLRAGLHEGHDVDCARIRTICRGLVQHHLQHMDGLEHGDEQFQLTAPGQRNQRPGIGDDDGPGHCAASEAANSCSSSAGS